MAVDVAHAHYSYIIVGGAAIKSLVLRYYFNNLVFDDDTINRQQRMYVNEEYLSERERESLLKDRTPVMIAISMNASESVNLCIKCKREREKGKEDFYDPCTIPSLI